MKTLKQILTTVALTVIALQLTAQTSNRCGTMEHHQWMMKTNSEYAKSFQHNEQVIQEYMASHANQRTSLLPDTIPVVVHVVYNTAGQNISDAQVQSQIDVLNEDFARLNADTVNTPAVWQPTAGTLPYRFILARRDPNGNATNGIVRVATTVTSFNTNDNVKFNATGGSDAWDVNTYLNLWACNLGGGLLGYAEFPTGTPSNTYGFVCIYTSFGRVGNVVAPYHLGRTTTHEIGHCFNLAHIWGDDGGACSGSDQVMDTPNQGDATFGCLTWPALDNCATASPGYMFMNYMDYTDDDCMNLFTQGQSARMVAAVNSFYPTIVNSVGMLPIVLQANDAGASAVVTPNGGICNTSIAPEVTLRNWGSANLTSATINYKIDNAALQTYFWTGNLASLATTNITLPAVTTTVGAHTFTSYTTQPNGVADPNNGNDTVRVTFNVLAAGQSGPITQSFNTATFPPASYTLINPDASATWERGTTATHTGTGAMFIDNFNYASNGQIDELVIPNLDLTSLSSPVFTFWVAYQLYTNPTTNPNFSDTLEVVVSTDCGATFSSIYKKSGTNLTTTTPVFSINQFFPTASQWRKETINLAAFATANTAIFKIRNITDYENNLYVDDINIETLTGVKDLSLTNAVEVYPNPGNGYFKLNINIAEAQNLQLTVTDAMGNTVVQKQYNAQSIHDVIDLSKQAAGVYLLHVDSDKGSVIKKLIVTN